MLAQMGTSVGGSKLPRRPSATGPGQARRSACAVRVAPSESLRPSPSAGCVPRPASVDQSGGAWARPGIWRDSNRADGLEHESPLLVAGPRAGRQASGRWARGVPPPAWPASNCGPTRMPDPGPPRARDQCLGRLASTQWRGCQAARLASIQSSAPGSGPTRTTRREGGRLSRPRRLRPPASARDVDLPVSAA